MTPSGTRHRGTAPSPLQQVPLLEPLAIRRKLYPNVGDSTSLSRVLIHTYCLPQISLLPISTLVSVFALPYYQSLGASYSYLLASVAVARGLDLAIAPLIACASDSSRSYYGRRRPFILFGLPVYIMFMILLFVPPLQFGASDKGTWFGLTYVGFVLCHSMFAIPYDALGAELADSHADRLELFCVGSIYRWLGTGAVFFLSTFVPDLIHLTASPTYTSPSSTTYLYTALIFSLWLFFTTISAVYWVVERAQASDVFGILPSPGIAAALQKCLVRPFAALLLPWMLDTCTYLLVVCWLGFLVKHFIVPETLTASSGLVDCTVTANSNPSRAQIYVNASYWTPYLCHSASFTGFLLVVLSAGGVVGSVVWRVAANRWGQKLCWIGQSFLVALALGGLSAAVGGVATNAVSYSVSIPSVLAMVALTGVGFGGSFMNDCLVCDAIDYDEFLTGQRCEGPLFLFKSLLPKLMTAACSVLPVCSLYSLGYNNPTPSTSIISPFGAAPPSDSCLLYILFMSAILPAAVSLLSCLAKLDYPLRTREHALLVYEGIGLHMQHRSAMCPLTACDYLLSPDLSMPGPPLRHSLIVDNFPAAAIAADFHATTAVGQPLSTVNHLVETSRDNVAVAFMFACAFLVALVLTFGYFSSVTLCCVPLLFIMLLCAALLSVLLHGLRLSAALSLKRSTNRPTLKTLDGILEQRRHRDLVERSDMVQVLEETPARRVLRKLRKRAGSVAPATTTTTTDSAALGKSMVLSESIDADESMLASEDEDAFMSRQAGGTREEVALSGSAVVEHWRRILQNSPSSSISGAKNDEYDSNMQRGAAGDDDFDDQDFGLLDALINDNTDAGDGDDDFEAKDERPTALDLEMWSFLREQDEINKGLRERYTQKKSMKAGLTD